MVITWLKKLAKPQTGAARVESTGHQPLPVDVTAEAIARRAYEKWVSRGRPVGTSIQDWLEAEAELRNETRPHKPR